MRIHLDTGQSGEKLAAQWLAQRGYTILACNWKYGRKEIDIIASLDNILHFIEVKTRRGHGFGMPEEQVTRRKLKNIKTAAEAYLEIFPQWRRVQFDIVSIIFAPEGHNIQLLEDIS
ncbi:YraN family protein [Flavihumibacter sp.]|uniref:YraN family protein n=1 Tax=Flavihumibacter sp. TaxID=1913981 RepID=UPI002FC9C6E6